MKKIHLAILNGGAVIGTERIEDPVYVHQTKNGIYRCIRVKAQGLLSADGEKIYQLEDKPEMERFDATVRVITTAEFEELQTPPDSDPELTAEEALSIIMGGNYEEK